MRSTPMTLRTPAFMRILLHATPEAPTPATTTFKSSIRFLTIFRELSSAARTTTAVPCWSSWKTGMSSSALSRSSISEHRGPVGDDGHGVPADRQGVRLLDVFRDRHADARHPGSVGHGEIVSGLDGDLAADLDLPAEMLEEDPVGYVHDFHPRA